ncbi:PAS domain S-box protein [Oceanibaculum pacificum]|uniref:PAS domain S-box protein n=1 Tax=Oceanibaculum pacificum TaxID=580166 RepID=UPI000A02F900|nr:PAS domain S-box protein [Oceanibaculum pacificum]
MVVDATERRFTEHAAHRLAAIVESSLDAILAKDLNGIITDWNQGAERLFGYSATEAIGKSVTMLIPGDRHNEEPVILAKIRRGERVEPYETVRQRKDGSLVDISLTVSPIINEAGIVVGASKIARDITEQKRALERQRLLLEEMNHRIKNLFTLASSVVMLSSRVAQSPVELARDVQGRLQALANAHALTLPYSEQDRIEPHGVSSFHELLRRILLPYGQSGPSFPFSIEGDDISISEAHLSTLALVLHELATNAAKYGALSVEGGHISILCTSDESRFHVSWEEKGGPPITKAPKSTGFGTYLAEMAIKGQLRGEVAREWRVEGLRTIFSIARN